MVSLSTPCSVYAEITPSSLSVLNCSATPHFEVYRSSICPVSMAKYRYRSASRISSSVLPAALYVICLCSRCHSAALSVQSGKNQVSALPGSPVKGFLMVSHCLLYCFGMFMVHIVTAPRPEGRGFTARVIKILSSFKTCILCLRCALNAPQMYLNCILNISQMCLIYSPDAGS